MYIARILYPIEVLGPGKRVGIWFVGCPRRCVGCSNPELWTFDDRYKTSIETVMSLIEKIAAAYPIDGFTITGGDPFYQRDVLSDLIDHIKGISSDILIYTGYSRDELTDIVSKKILSSIAVLIDGVYIESRNNGSLLRGSDNQTIHILSDEHRARYEKYLETATNRIQNFAARDGVISVGIHRRDFKF